MADQNILIKFSADTTDLKRGTAEANAAMKDVKGAVDATSSAMSNYNTKVGTATASTIELEKRLKFLNNGLQEEAYEIKNGEVVLKQKTAATAQATAATTVNTTATAANTTASKAFTIATNLARAAVNALKVAMTGGLIIAMSILVQNWEKIAKWAGISTRAIDDNRQSIEKSSSAIDDNNREVEANIKLLKAQGVAEQELQKIRAQSLNDQIREKNELIRRNLDEQRRLEQKLLERDAKSYLDIAKEIVTGNALSPQFWKDLTTTSNDYAEEIGALRKQAAELGVEVTLLNADLLTTSKVTTEANKNIKQTEYQISLLNDTLKVSQELIDAVNVALNQNGEPGLQIISDEQLKRFRQVEQSLQAIGDTSVFKSFRQANPRQFKNGREEEIEQEKEYLNYLSQSLQFVNDLVNLISSARNARINAEIADLERLRDAELKNAELTARQKEKIEERYQKQIAKLKTQQAKADRRAAIAQAVINGALAITNILATTPGGPLNPKVIASLIIAAATTAAQVAVIASQPLPKFRKGGEITGNRHETGGVHIEAEGGEFMMRREAVDKYGKDFMKKVNNLALPQSIAAPVLTPNVINLMGNKGIDHEKLGVTISRELSKQPKVMIQMDQNGFTKSIQQGVKTTYYANRKFRAS